MIGIKYCHLIFRSRQIDATIIVPTYNESENIPELVSRIRRVCNNVEILVIDDSPDNKTSDSASFLGCKVIHRVGGQRGLSSAVILGIKMSNTNKVIVMDADLQHPPEVLPKMIDGLDYVDMVIGSRWVKGGGVAGWSKQRIMVSKIANCLAYGLVPGVKDRTSGLFGVCKSSIKTEILNPIGWKICLEILVKCKPSLVVEVPYTFATRTKGKSKYNMKQVRAYLKHLWKLYLR